MAHQKNIVSRDDIAAMDVVCSRLPQFTHRLNLKHIDVRWVLDLKDRAGSRANSVQNSVVRSRQGDPAPTTPSGAHGEEGSKAAPQSAARGETDRSDARGAVTPATPLVHLSTGRGSSKFYSDEDKAAEMAGMFVPRPATILSLEHLDRTTSLEDAAHSTILVSSPRSALAILKMGLNLPDLCGVPVQEYFNQGLLDAATVETVHSRISAEEERRQERFRALMSMYRKICAHVPRDALVDAIRLHHYGHQIEQRLAEQRLQNISHFAHSGKLDITVLDADCVDVVQRSRHRTLTEIRRVLDLRDRLQRQELEKENRMLEKERQHDMEHQRVIKEQAERNAERAKQLREKRSLVERRVEQLMEARRELMDRKRDQMEQHEMTLKERQEHKDMLEREASAQLIATRERKRKHVKEQQEVIIEQRRQEIVEKGEVVDLINHYHKKKRDAALAERSKRFNLLTRQRRQAINASNDAAARERQMQLDEMESRAVERAEWFEARRAERVAHRQQHALERGEQRELTKATADAIYQQRLMEMQEEYEIKQQNIEIAKEEQKHARIQQQELRTEIRHDKNAEADRNQAASEFANIGFMATAAAKTEWMEREVRKRKALGTQIRQEREAMVRTRNQILTELDETDIKRHKELTFRALSKTPAPSPSPHPAMTEVTPLTKYETSPLFQLTPQVSSMAPDAQQK